MTAPIMILHRPPETPPTEPGWYYTQYGPTKVEKRGGKLCVWSQDSYDNGNDGRQSLNVFTWFGPVPECVEARLP